MYAEIMNKKQHPIITTKCLILRAYTLDDAQECQPLIGDYAIADTQTMYLTHMRTACPKDILVDAIKNKDITYEIE